MNRRVYLRHWNLPNYWQETIEPVLSGSHAVRRMRELFATYTLEDAEGVAFFFDDDNENTLEVDYSYDYWAIALDRSDGSPTIAIGNRRAKGTRPFLLPEWTEVDCKYLIASDLAADIVIAWIETGQLSSGFDWAL